jgi:hypothetical protein
MMPVFPEYLKATSQRINIVKAIQCDKCKLTRRLSDDVDINESNSIIDDFCQSRLLYDLSLNILLCQDHSYELNCKVTDVLFRVRQNPSVSPQSIHEVPKDPDDFEYLETPILILSCGDILSIKGKFPKRDQRGDEKLFSFNLNVNHEPLLYNVYHYQFQVITFAPDRKVEKYKRAGYQEIISTSVRTSFVKQFLQGKFAIYTSHLTIALFFLLMI